MIAVIVNFVQRIYRLLTNMWTFLQEMSSTQQAMSTTLRLVYSKLYYEATLHTAVYPANLTGEEFDVLPSPSFTIPANVQIAYISAIGGGGGGGASGQYKSGGGGGGSAQFTRRAAINVLPLSTYPIVIGVGGAPQTPGGATSFSTVSCVGGNAGGNSSNDGKPIGLVYYGGGGGSGGGASGGAGGAGGGNGGGYNGVNGGYPNLIPTDGYFSGAGGGGGVGGAGSGNYSGAGGQCSTDFTGGSANQDCAGGGGASSPWGKGANGTSVNQTGLNATGYGAGGSGAARWGSGVYNGGSGSPGWIKIEWYQ